MMQFYGSAMYIKCNYTAEECAIMISGIPFTYDSNPSEIAPIIHLLKMLPFVTVKRPFKLQFFEILTETCFVLEHGYLQSMSQHKSDDIHFKREVHWGLKAIECRLLIRDATVFVCKRLPFKSSSLLKHALNGSFDVLHQNTNLGTLNALMLPCEEMMTLYTVYDYCIIHNKYPCVYGKYSQICRPVLCTVMFIYVENMVVFAYHLCVTNMLTALQQKTRTTVSIFLVQV